jgi:tape measure domain-containing protein
MADEVGIKITLDGKSVTTEAKNMSKVVTEEFVDVDKTVEKTDKKLEKFSKTVINVKNDYSDLTRTVKQGFATLEKNSKSTSKNNRAKKDSVNLIRVTARTNKILESSMDQLNVTLKEQTAILEKRTRAQKRSNTAKKNANNGLINLSSSLTLFNVGLAATVFGTIRAVKGLIDLKDEYKLMKSQLRLVADDVKNLNNLQEDLLKTSNETRQGIKNTVTLYARLDRATRQLAISDREVLGVTETLNKAIIISGASTQESSAAIFQLSQGMASGVLRGQELNSILEQTPRIAQLIAEGMGKTVGQLRALGAAGELTTEKIVAAVQSQTEVINSEFQKVEATSGQIWTRLGNNAGSYIDKLEELNAAQGAFNSLLGFASDVFSNLDKAKTLEIAKKTKAENRTFKDQQKIFADLFQQKLKSNRFDVAVQANLARNIKLAEEDLAVILARDKAKGEGSAKSKKNAEEAEKRLAEALFLLRANAAFEQGISEKARTNEIIRNRAAKEYNDELLEMVRLENQRVEIQNETDTAAKFEFEKELLLESESFNKDIFEQKIERVNQEKDARLLAAGEIAETEQELIKLTEKIFENSAKKKGEIEKAQLDATVAATAGSLSDLSGALKGAFNDNKAFAIADIGFKAAQGAAQALTLPPPADVIKLAAVGINAGVQIAKVNQQKFAGGTESVQGNGTGTSDQVDVKVSPRERIVPEVINEQLNGVRNSDLPALVNNSGNTYQIMLPQGSDSAFIKRVANAIREIERDRTGPGVLV